MKPLIVFVAFLAIVILVSARAESGCRVACRNVAVVEQFVAVPAAIVTGVPVATYGTVGYSYTPAPQPIPVTVNVTFNKDEIAQAVVDKLTGPAPQQNTPPLPSAPPVPGPLKAPASTEPELQPPAPPTPDVPPPPAPTMSAVMQNCSGCHSPGHNAALAKFNPSLPLTCEQRLVAARAVLSGKMPKGKGPLPAEAAGAVLEDLIGK